MSLSDWQAVGRLLAEASALGAAFRIRGDQVEMINSNGVPADVLTGLRDRAGLVFEFLDGTRPSREARRFFAGLQVHAELVTSPADVPVMFAALDRDSVLHGGSIAIDIETAPLPGQGPPRPTIRLNKDGALAAVQPVLRDRTGLSPHQSYIAVLQLFAGGSTAFVVHGADAIAAVPSSRWMHEHDLVGHNVGFEIAFLQQWSAAHPRTEGDPPLRQIRIDCTAQGAGLLCGVGYGGSGRGLADAAQHFLGQSPPKALQTSDWSAPQLGLGQLAYAASDAVLTRPDVDDHPC